jgi:hypothetical protein
MLDLNPKGGERGLMDDVRRSEEKREVSSVSYEKLPRGSVRRGARSS